MLPKEREYLVLDNLNLVHFILRNKYHMYPYYQDYDDYYQEGCIGLILAAIRFDESKGFEFSTYATSMILGSIRRYRRDKENIVRIPRHRYDMIKEVSKLSSQGFTPKEIKELTGYSYYDIQRAVAATHVNSLDEVMYDDSKQEITLHDMISDGSDYYKDLLSQENILESIDKVTSQMTIETTKDIWEEWIWSMIYGEKLSQCYLASKYGMSQANVSRLLTRCKELFEKELYE